MHVIGRFYIGYFIEFTCIVYQSIIMQISMFNLYLYANKNISGVLKPILALLQGKYILFWAPCSFVFHEERITTLVSFFSMEFFSLIFRLIHSFETISFLYLITILCISQRPLIRKLSWFLHVSLCWLAFICECVLMEMFFNIFLSLLTQTLS